MIHGIGLIGDFHSQSTSHLMSVRVGTDVVGSNFLAVKIIYKGFCMKDIAQSTRQDGTMRSSVSRNAFYNRLHGKRSHGEGLYLEYIQS